MRFEGGGFVIGQVDVQGRDGVWLSARSCRRSG
jgi:hypothetical protein